MTSVLLASPPLMMPNGPYPATAYLTGFLRSRGITAHQVDLSILLVIRLLSRAFLPRLRRAAERYAAGQEAINPTVAFFLEAYADYERAIDPVIAFLQGRDPGLAHRIGSRTFCPEGPGSAALQVQADLLTHAYGELALPERAKLLAARFLVNLVEVITLAIDRDFVPWRYGRDLVGPDFGPLAAKLAGEPSLIDRELLDLWVPILKEHRPDLVGLTVPFMGSCYGALRLAKTVREILPRARIALGGGFVGNHLRNLDEPAVFEFLDYIVLDAGERPLECLIEHLQGRRPRSGLHRTWVRENGQVAYQVQEELPDIPQALTGYAELPLDRYFSAMQVPNAVGRLQMGLRWHKLSLAHGCYWRQCAFCETSLDYVCRYDPAPVALTLERMERIAAETGGTGFHFVDEVAAPKLLKALSQALIERDSSFSWFTNIRFERAFADPELTDLMARAGCIGVAGGLETASDRLLTLMDKGITIAQAARACRALAGSGISVHAYLMYGFPTETEQDTLDNLERVRQLFALGYVRSANWSPFSLTLHSPVARNPDRYGIRLRISQVGCRNSPSLGLATGESGHGDVPMLSFSTADRGRKWRSLPGPHRVSPVATPSQGDFACPVVVPYEDPTPYDRERLGLGLKRASYHFNRGLGLERDVRSWFPKPLDPPGVPPDLIRSLAPPDADQGARRRQPWRPAGADWVDQPRHGFRASDWIVARTDGEALILLDFSDHTPYRLEGIGAECWRLLAAGLSIAEIAGRLAATYAAPREQVLADIRALIDELRHSGLLQEHAGGGEPSEPHQ